MVSALALDVWNKFPSKVKRIITIGMVFVLSLAITIAGTLTPLTEEEITQINNELEDLRGIVYNSTVTRGTALIFGNNFMLCLSFFVPFFGPFFGGYVLYSTGVSIAAQSAAEGMNPVIVLLSLFILPFTWLEFIAYSTAIAQSVWLTWRIIKHRGKRELVNTCVMISLCAVILLIAAIIEILIIQAVTSTL